MVLELVDSHEVGMKYITNMLRGHQLEVGWLAWSPSALCESVIASNDLHAHNHMAMPYILGIMFMTFIVVNIPLHTRGLWKFAMHDYCCI